MKKPKRKYIHKVTPDAPEPISSPVKREVNGKLLGDVTDADILLLPPSLKAQLEAGTRMRKILKMPDNLKERTKAMVRRFRGC